MTEPAYNMIESDDERHWLYATPEPPAYPTGLVVAIILTRLASLGSLLWLTIAGEIKMALIIGFSFYTVLGIVSMLEQTRLYLQVRKLEGQQVQTDWRARIQLKSLKRLQKDYGQTKTGIRQRAATKISLLALKIANTFRSLKKPRPEEYKVIPFRWGQR